MEGNAVTLIWDLPNLSYAFQYHSRCLRFSWPSTMTLQTPVKPYCSASDSVISMPMTGTLMDWESASRQNESKGVCACMHTQCDSLSTLQHHVLLMFCFPRTWLKSFWRNSLLENFPQIKYVYQKGYLCLLIPPVT